MYKYKFLIFFLIIVFIGLISILSVKVDEIVCISQFYTCNESVRDSINLIHKSNLINTRKNLIRALKGEVIVKNFSFQYQLDGKLILHVDEREPKYCISNNEKTFYADESGLVMRLGSEQKIECVHNTNSLYKISDNFRNEDLLSEQIYLRLRNLKDIGNGSIEEKKLVIEYNNNIKLIFPIEGQADELLGKAYYTISQFDKINEYIIDNGFSGISEVDFRYNNPVIRYI